ncbi:MAG: NYN domain-containing protein [Anaerolineae bacterium]|nr:NYN domain-containing protein [Anaerolineae bacterium]
METNLRLALMIDGDNAQAALLPQMLAEVSKYGTMTIRRVYGDWSEPGLKSWKDVLHIYAIQPSQQFSYTKGKNATDIALIIDAMDILHSGSVDGFCIASSDSDYTRLATRVREQNLFVMGIGRQNTPPAFVNACTVFVYTENLQALAVDGTKPEVPVPMPPTERAIESIVKDAADPARLEALFRTAFELAVQDDGWAHLGAMGSSLRQLDPAFDPRTYKHKQLSQLVRAYPKFIEVREDKTNGGTGAIYIRLKAKSQKSK